MTVQKTFEGGRALSEKEMRRIQKRKDERQNSKVIEGLCVTYRRLFDCLRMFMDLRLEIKPAIETDEFQACLPYPSSRPLLLNCLDWLAETFQTLNDYCVDLSDLRPTKATVTRLTRAIKRFQRHLPQISLTFWSIQAQLEFKLDPIRKVVQNKHPLAMKVVSAIKPALDEGESVIGALRVKKKPR